jgi:hypothetical protein
MNKQPAIEPQSWIVLLLAIVGAMAVTTIAVLTAPGAGF